MAGADRIRKIFIDNHRKKKLCKKKIKIKRNNDKDPWNSLRKKVESENGEKNNKNSMKEIQCLKTKTINKHEKRQRKGEMWPWYPSDLLS